MTRLRKKIPSKILLRARQFAQQVCEKKTQHNPSLCYLGNDELADRLGFDTEFSVCHIYNHPFPKLLEENKVDEYDLEIVSEKDFRCRRFDVKSSKNCLINRAQFESKRVDAYLFAVMDYRDFEHGLNFVELIGWIERDKVEDASELVGFGNGTQAFKVNKRKLRDCRELTQYSQKIKT
jgi:hypothetical protein